MKTLVVYYSRTGHTQQVAEQLAAALGATLCPITEPGSRLGPLGYARSLIEGAFGRDAPIRAAQHDPAGYDLVLLGTPIWGWHLSSPVRAFARRHAKQIRRAAFFCTMGGSGAEQAFAELEQLIGHPPVATLAITEAELGTAAARATAGKIKRLADKLRPPAVRHARAA
jgi:flavodoxin